MTPVDSCPRCGRPFRCGVDDAAPCPCTTVAVRPATLARLRGAYVGCLCPGCLREEAGREAAPVGEDRRAEGERRR